MPDTLNNYWESVKNFFIDIPDRIDRGKDVLIDSGKTVLESIPDYIPDYMLSVYDFAVVSVYATFDIISIFYDVFNGLMWFASDPYFTLLLYEICVMIFAVFETRKSQNIGVDRFKIFLKAQFILILFLKDVIELLITTGINVIDKVLEKVPFL